LGKLTFRVPSQIVLTPQDHQVIHAVGSDRLVRRAAVSGNSSSLTVDLWESDGVKLKVPFRDAARDPVLLSTCALAINNPQPYNLLLELARGALYRFRNLVAACHDAEIQPTDDTKQLLKESTDNFAQAVILPKTDETADELAFESLNQSLSGTRQLESIYATASQKAVQQHAPNRAFLRGIELSKTPDDEISALLESPLNSVIIEPNWKRTEPKSGQCDWSETEAAISRVKQKELTTVLGPMIRLDQLTTPEWLYLWDGNFEEVATAVEKYVQQAVVQFKDRVDLWYFAASFNDRVAIALSEEERLRLMLLAIQTMRKTGLRAPMLVSFARPFGEYLANSERELAPIHFAEELVRARVGVTGVGLELNFGELSPATYYRGFFDIEEILDQWSMLGVPLFVKISAPSSWREDPNAQYSLNRSEEPQERISRRTQREQIARVLPAIVTHPQVQGVFWSPTSDALPHNFPHSGLLDNRWRPKSTINAIRKILNQFFAKTS